VRVELAPRGDAPDPERAQDGLEAPAHARTKRLSMRGARRLARINRTLADRCRFRHIQAAVRRAGNNDRVVVMPGLYLEEPSRRKPTDDPRCVQYEEESENGAGAATYRYQVLEQLQLLRGRLGR
jgi:hypothetical protein